MANASQVSAQNMLEHAKVMAASQYQSELDVEEKEFRVKQAQSQVKLIETRIDVLKRFTKEEQLATLNGDLNAAMAKHEADKERALADEKRLLRAKEEFDNCVIRAKRDGLVIYPSGEEWEEAPDIEQGATVHKDQVLLLMPDLSQMQVRIGVHESLIDRVAPGQTAIVSLAGMTLDGKVDQVSAVAEPAGWWTGNVVKYQTIVAIPSEERLKPGKSVAVEVLLARHEDVLTVPMTAVVETDRGYACWVRTAEGTSRRALQLGDSDELSIIVVKGLQEGDEVVLNPLSHVEEAQNEARTPTPAERRGRQRAVTNRHE